MSLRFITSPPLASISDHPSSVKPVEYTFNSKIMVAAMVILFIVVFFVVSLHVYAKWFWRQGISSSLLATTGARNVSWRRGRRHSPDVASIESVTPNMCVGLDSSTINSLPTFTYEATQHDMEAPLLECAVCLSEFQAHEKGRFLPNCKHSFHIDCIDMWFHSHSTCPLCRAPVSSLAHQHHEQTTPIQRDFPPPLLQSIVPSTTRQHDERNTTLQRVNSLPLSLLQRPELPTTHHPHQEGPANNASTAPVLPRLEVPLATLLHASNGAGLLCKDGSHAGSHTSLPGIGASGSSSTRWMSTGIPSQPECGAIARCVSLSMPRCPSEEIQARSLQVPQKSSSFRMSIKWLLSRESSKGRSRVFPSSQGNAELEPSTSNSVLPQ